MAKVSLQHVFKVYKDDKSKNVTAVNDFNLEINDREFMVFVGPSGCGKSTTIRMIAGLEEISEGNIFIGDRCVNDVAPKDRDIAMVFQNYALYPHLSVYDNLAFGLKLRGFAKAEIRKRVQDAAEILGLESYLDRKPKALSGGQRQRVAVGRAIVRQPKVFLFDEPLSNLDAKMRVQMRLEISKLHRRLQTTTIYVTHDQVEAMTMGDRIVVMKDGVIQQVDTPLALYNQPVNLFVAEFLGSPPMNFIKGRITAGNGTLIFKEAGEGTIQCRLDESLELGKRIGEEMIMGVRPEDLAWTPASIDEGQDRFAAMVDLIEPTGAETNIYLSTGAHTAVCRTQGSIGHDEAGRRHHFEIQRSGIHLFDPVSTQRIAGIPNRGT
jgi:multiple sugar transport system ATP-binding protein